MVPSSLRWGQGTEEKWPQDMNQYFTPKFYMEACIGSLGLRVDRLTAAAPVAGLPLHTTKRYLNSHPHFLKKSVLGQTVVKVMIQDSRNL